MQFAYLVLFKQLSIEYFLRFTIIYSNFACYFQKVYLGFKAIDFQRITDNKVKTYFIE